MNAPRLPRALAMALLCFPLLAPALLRAQDDRPPAGEQPRRPDEPPPPGERPQERPDEPEIDPVRLRQRLARMLEQTEASAERIRSALATLDEGGSVRDAIDQLGGPTRVRQWSEDWARWNNPGPGADWDRGREGPPEVERERVLDFLAKHAPELAERIRSLRAEDDRRAEFFIGRLTPRIAEILAAEDRDPELAAILLREFKVGMALLDAGARLGKARESGDEAGIEEIRASIRTLAEEQVDLRLARREHEIAMLAERIESLQVENHEQRDEREKLIDEVVDRVTRDDRPNGPPSGDGRRQRRQGRP